MTTRDGLTGKREVAKLLDEIGRYIALNDANRFKTRAFQNAARSIEGLEIGIDEFIRSGQIDRTPGIGKAIGPIIAEFVSTGRSSYLDELKAEYPPGIFELARIKGLGVKKIGELHAELGVSNIDELESACRQNRLVSMQGFGQKTQEKILAEIETLRSRCDQFLLSVALGAAETILESVRNLDSIERAELSGSVRRKLEIVTGIEIVAVPVDPDRAVSELASIGLLYGGELLADRRWSASARNGIPVLVHLCRAEDLAVVLFESTGTGFFVESIRKRASAKGYRVGATTLEKRGTPIRVEAEEALFSAIGSPFVEPELREEESPPPPKIPLVDRRDLQGTFHVHSTYSDGRGTLCEMLTAAFEQQRFRYVGISDHSKSATYARGLTEERVDAQHDEIEKLRKSFPDLEIFKGTEADILPDGRIDFDDATLAKFDFVIASVHSKFKMPPDEMTARIVRAISNPHVTFLGHLTGRLLLSRPGYTFDFDEVFDAAAERGVMIEINGNPYRLELDWRLIRRAFDRGVRFSIHPDAHSTDSLADVARGIAVARKGGLTADDIFNTRPSSEIARHFEERKKRARRG